VKTLHEYLTRDHERLDALLDASVRRDGTIDPAPYTQFRAGLLRHIGIEEKILFPSVRMERGRSALIEQLHRDHAALAALLVPPPSTTEVETIRAILAEHNPLEENDGGLYDIAEEIAGDALEALLVAAQGTPDVALAAHFDTTVTRRSIEQLLKERKGK
jgi:hypothetical protein